MTDTKAQVVDVPARDKGELDPTEPIVFDVLDFSMDEQSGAEAKINILASNEEHDVVGTLKLYLKKYDEGAKKYVTDDETYERSMETLKRAKFAETEGYDPDDESMATAELADLLATNGAGYSFLGYANDEQRVSFYPIQSYVRFAKIDAPAAKELRKPDLENKAGPLEITVNNRYHRFDIGFTYDFGEDEPLNFRVAQLRTNSGDDGEDEVEISLKFTNRDVDNAIDKCEKAKEDGEDPAHIARLEKAVEKMVELGRKRVVKNVKEKFGVDLEELMENDETLVFEDVEVTSIPGNTDKSGGKIYYLIGTPAVEDDE